MLPLFYHDSPPHSRKSTRKALKLHFLSRQTGCKRSFFTPQPPGCGKGGKSTAFMRVSSPKTTTENCMDYPVWNELFTFSTGFSTVFVKKKRSFQRCFPPFPHSFPHPVEESPIQAVMDAAAFWKFVGKNVGNLPVIKKKVEGFSFLFTVYSGLRVCFSPIWNFAPGSFPQTAGEKNPVWKTDTNCGFPHCFYPADAAEEFPPSPSQALPRQLSRRESQAVNLDTKVLGAMRKLPAALLPLPLGEVDLRSKDGEGARRQPYR